jgi:hypothetical protein
VLAFRDAAAFAAQNPAWTSTGRCGSSVEMASVTTRRRSARIAAPKWAASLVLLVALASGGAAHGKDEFSNVAAPVIPVGQEELLAAMLGKGTALPDGCKLESGDVAESVVRATYSCPSGTVVYELAHPGSAGTDATRTEQFAITVDSGSPPPALTLALESSIRARERAFVWKQPSDPRAASYITAAVLAVGVLAVIVLVFAVRRLAGSRTRGSAPAA